MAKRHIGGRTAQRSHIKMFLEYMNPGRVSGVVRNSGEKLFELLYPSVATPTIDSPSFSFFVHSTDAYSKTAFYQAACVDEVLKQRFALPMGLDDSRASVLNLTPDSVEYPYTTPMRTDLSFDFGWKIPVILGVLPTMDVVEAELFRNASLFAEISGCQEADDSEASTQGLFLQRDPMPLPEYWSRYAEYLKQRPATTHTAPVFPARYRELLEYRQQLRDRRIQYLREYTGLHRAKARDDDALAGGQAIFFRLAELMLREVKEGVAALAASPALLDHPGMAGMRKSLLNTCDFIAVSEIDAGEETESSERNECSGVALFLLSKTVHRHRDGREGKVLYRKHADIDAANASLITTNNNRTQTKITPNARNKYSFLPPKVSREYLSWPSLLEIAAVPPINGLMEKRRGALVDIDRHRLEQRMRNYFDKDVPWAKILETGTGLSEPQNRFEPRAVRDAALDAGVGFNRENIQPYTIKPFDDRWCYHSKVKYLWSDPKLNFAALCGADNSFFVTRAGKVVPDEGVPFFFTTFLGDNDLLRGHSYYFPSWHLRENGNRAPNISDRITECLHALGILPASDPLEASRQAWNHVLAMAFSPAYLRENAEGIGQDWARIPFPTVPKNDKAAVEKAKAAFLESCRLGSLVADLLNPAAGVNGVTQGAIRPELENIGVLCDTRKDDSFAAGEPAAVFVTMEWGKLSKDRSVLLSHGGQGLRGFTHAERHRLEKGALAAEVHTGALYSCLGEEFYELHLNENASIRNVPSKVHHFTIGGYPVLKKWLSYRETAIIGRPLTVTEVQGFTNLIRRITALLLLEPRLNHNYAVIRDLHSAFLDRKIIAGYDGFRDTF